MIYRLFAALALAALVVGSVLMSREQRDSVESVTQRGPAEDLGYAARDAQFIETGEDGFPLYTLNAEVVRQQPADGNVELEQVRMTFRDANDSQWTLRADRGFIRQDATKIELQGGVHVAGNVPGTAQPAEILTEELHFDTETEIVTTEAPVTLNWSGHALRSLGLTANLKEQRVQLESRVNGRFSP